MGVTVTIKDDKRGENWIKSQMRRLSKMIVTVGVHGTGSTGTGGHRCPSAATHIGIIEVR